MFSKEKTDFILDIYKKGQITKKTQKIFRGFGYYLMIWALRDEGIIELKGVNEKEKIWTLTEKGKKIAKYLKQIRKIEEEMK